MQGQLDLTDHHGQLVFAFNREMIIPKNDSVRLLKVPLEELEQETLRSVFFRRKEMAGRPQSYVSDYYHAEDIAIEAASMDQSIEISDSAIIIRFVR